MSIVNDQIVPAFRRSGKTQEDFCAEHGVSIHKLRYYLYKRTKRVKPLLPEKHSQPTMPNPVPSPSFISFNHHTDNQNDAKHTFTIINVRFTIKEMGQLLRAIEEVPC